VARVPNAQLTREGQFLGTPCYAAPETLAQGQYGRHSDLFSFAAVLYEAVSGMRAFPGDDAVGVAHKVITDEPPAPSMVAPRAKVPPEVDRVIMRGLSKDASARPATASDLVRELRDAYVASGMLSAAEAASNASNSAVGISGTGTGGGGGGGGAAASRSGDGKMGSTIAFVAMLLGLLGVGIALIFAFAGIPTGDDLPDAGVLPLVSPDGGQLPTDAGALLTDAGLAADGARLLPPDARAGISPLADAGAAALPAIDSGIAAMSAHDREEAAKDALDEAERALGAGNRAAAAALIERARLLDPSNSDIARLAARLLADAGPR
jgi:serine/threonine-protein kinase